MFISKRKTKFVINILKLHLHVIWPKNYLFFYYLILLFQLSVANPENFEEFKAWEELKIRKEKTGIPPTSTLKALDIHNLTQTHKYVLLFILLSFPM